MLPQANHHPEQGVETTIVPIDGFQMLIKCPTSGGQTCNKEAAVQWDLSPQEK